mmetsp:Transcript_14325/g.18803  ORF Transcript_14325/g.18803 Transcript_14325/m.18803 type:complete len:108 (+) Transcript_14325:346-669(+)|eukprot:CAMPEP_0195251124 /NCGR_PEP_ID=MMETSP0706-20130129/3101_1 /TAXON_ID=33640 /ORGANISM="Asterionellopsis glacialis, Strain CCMP134" /LENGTH=107 /DNA_ID=CAMNT_0040303211 /DNA_START=587 /DNA_END=913 /DNA_ORIENTATION=-
MKFLQVITAASWLLLASTPTTHSSPNDSKMKPAFVSSHVCLDSKSSIDPTVTTTTSLNYVRSVKDFEMSIGIRSQILTEKCCVERNGETVCLSECTRRECSQDGCPR